MANRPLSSSGLSSHVADSLSLYLSKENMLNTVITGPSMTYEVVTPPKAGLLSKNPTTTITRVDRDESGVETRYIVGEFIWTTVKKTVLRIPDQPGCENWIPKGHFLRKMPGKRRWGKCVPSSKCKVSDTHDRRVRSACTIGVFSSSRLFTGPSGAQYRWKESGMKGLTTVSSFYVICRASRFAPRIIIRISANVTPRQPRPRCAHPRAGCLSPCKARRWEDKNPGSPRCIPGANRYARHRDWCVIRRPLS
ncbi:hypothetical protein BOTBODRAFT_29818 [Botryobasidium botryosum FD-172 SS1]|uniref:DUF6593 domain-containing protein n=1 Tax=Botryobasidium botryosum (strain FD-172 SS1) TaxID=930990 RepID=A0A067MQ07_BOTB1|nr:hypothetical protein BOTBODRAFT_29818 [Botryobasidium botryosum FD-172 SS1]